MSLLVFENIAKAFKNQTVLKDVNLRIERGERVALIGANGSGKTTLIKIVTGEEFCDSGRVIIARNIKVAYLSQDMCEINSEEAEGGTALHYDKVIHLENKIRQLEKEMEIAAYDNEKYNQIMNRYSRVLSEYEALDGYTLEKKIKKILLGLGLRQEALSIPLNNLSGGEKMRVLIARMLLQEPDLIILDEPTNHLDIQARESVENALNEFRGTVIAISHDRYYLNHCVDRILEVTSTGKIISYNGNYDFYKSCKETPARNIKSNKNQMKTRQNYTISEKSKKVNTDNVENKIIQLEEKIKDLENSFDESTPRENYSEYSAMLEELEDLYGAL